MGGKVTLRPLGPEDAPLLLKWLTDPAVLEWYEGRDNPFTPEKVQEHFYGGDEVSRYAVLYEGGPVGYVQTYRLEEEERAEYGCPEELAPAFGMDQFIGETDCWGRHIGRAFMGLALERLAAEGARVVYVDPHADNGRAIRCYEACGFKKCRFLPRHELHEGVRRDCWLMEYRV